MARLFVSGSSEYLYVNDGLVSGPPLTFACWCYIHDITNPHTLISIGDSESDDYCGLQARGNVAGDPFYMTILGVGAAVTTTGYSANTWHHACGQITTLARTVYIDGGSKHFYDGDASPAITENRTTIGVSADNTPYGYTDGHIAEAVIWNVALTDAEVLAHATGVSAWQIRPQNIVFYADLIRDLNDKAGGLVLTASGTVVSPHPRIIEEGSIRGVWAIPAVEGVAPTGVLRGPFGGSLYGPIM